MKAWLDYLADKSLTFFLFAVYNLGTFLRLAWHEAKAGYYWLAPRVKEQVAKLRAKW